MTGQEPEESPFRLISFARVPIRTREGTITLAGWRAEADSDRGPGAILLVDLPDRGSIYRGEGTFLGWTQEALGTTYDAIRPRSEPDMELQQLG